MPSHPDLEARVTVESRTETLHPASRPSRAPPCERAADVRTDDLDVARGVVLAVAVSLAVCAAFLWIVW